MMVLDSAEVEHGWMHDFTRNTAAGSYFRKGDHYGMTFALTYAYSENYILVLSHDEVLHLKMLYAQ